MKKILSKSLLTLMVIPFLTTSCSDDVVDPGQNVIEVVFNAVPKVDGTIDLSILEGTTVTFTEIRNQDNKFFTLNAAGRANVRLTRGVYNITIEKKITNEQGEEIVISLLMENININADGQVITGYINSLPASALGKDFIFSEVFFNGERNYGRMMHPDQYIVLFNPTEETLYADGVCIGVTQHIVWQNKPIWYDSYYPERVAIGGFITIPGSGEEHPVAPGEKLVIAFTAINHPAVYKEENEGLEDKGDGIINAVDLSGADFEIFQGPEAKDIDNPDVPNVLITENGDSYGFFLQPRGYVSPLIFRLKDGRQETIDAFVRQNTTLSKTEVAATESTPAGEIDIHILSVKTSDILDAIQTSDVPQDVKTRVIPEVLDRGKFLVNGCHRGELCIRKKIMVGNKVYYQDTNNSSEDCLMQQGQHAFPIGWRNK